MAEFADNSDIPTAGIADDTDEHTAPKPSRRPSIGLFLAGLAAILVSVWALVGPFSLEPLANVEFRWLFVVAAVVIGAVLVFSPGRRRKPHETTVPRPVWWPGRCRVQSGGNHSHSIVPGGLLVTSSTTRLTSATSLVIRVEMRSSTSYGRRVQSAVIASSLETGRSTIG